MLIEAGFPVKKTSDLLLLRSNCIEKEKSGVIKQRTGHRLPLINLSKNYDDINCFDALMSVVPDLSECRSLTVNGNIKFGNKVTIKGDVTISSTSDEIQLIENKVIEDKSIVLDFKK